MTWHRRAFSLIELLIVIVIIAILIALIVVGLQRVQVAAARTESANALRQMIAAYHGYSGDNNNRLMPGYVDYDIANPSPKAPLLNAKLANGNWMVEVNAQFDDRENLGSYVWRLSPYLSHNWQTVMTDYRDRGTIAYFSGQVDQEIYGPADDADAATVASAPSYGLNSIFFGGDDRHGGAQVTNNSPWAKNPDVQIAATRASEVINPRAIVFAPAAQGKANWQPGDVYETVPGGANGYPELRPPFLIRDAKGVWDERQWRLGERGHVEPVDGSTKFNKGIGLPIVRRGGTMIPIASFDGSAEVINIGELEVDMRRWSPLQAGTMLPPARVD